MASTDYEHFQNSNAYDCYWFQSAVNVIEIMKDVLPYSYLKPLEANDNVCVQVAYNKEVFDGKTVFYIWCNNKMSEEIRLNINTNVLQTLIYLQGEEEKKEQGYIDECNADQRAQMKENMNV